MTDFVFNISKGRVAEFCNRVKQNDPAASRLVVMPLEAAGLETKAQLEDSDTFAEVLDGATNEQTTMGRKFLTDVDAIVLTEDEANNRMLVDVPDITWAGATGNPCGGLIFGYDSTGAQPDSAIVPLVHLTFVVTPDGTNIVAQINADGIFAAS